MLTSRYTDVYPSAAVLPLHEQGLNYSFITHAATQRYCGVSKDSFHNDKTASHTRSRLSRSTIRKHFSTQIKPVQLNGYNGSQIELFNYGEGRFITLSTSRHFNWCTIASLRSRGKQRIPYGAHDYAVTRHKWERHVEEILIQVVEWVVPFETCPLRNEKLVETKLRKLLQIWKLELSLPVLQALSLLFSWKGIVQWVRQVGISSSKPG